MDYVLILVFALLHGYAAATCRFPGAPAHSRVSFSEDALEEGTVATYYCERGFELLGPARRVCGADEKWTPDGIPFCVLNVAAGKAPMHISTEDGGVSQRALDGSTSLVYNPETCTLTKPDRVTWWYVNLLEPYMVQLVRLDFGKPCCGTNKPAVIIVRVGNNRPDLGTNPICNQFTGFIEEGQPLFLPCNPPMPGAFVSVHLEASTPSQLSLCETFVYTDQALPIERCPQFRDQPLGSTATYNGKCYIFYHQEPLSLGEALNFCRARGGTLVDESNPALQGFVSWELWRRHRSDSNSQYWLGAVRDSHDPFLWKWVNGQDVVVSFWNAPVGPERCARFDSSRGWLWADTDCDTPLNYICQHQPKSCGRPEQPPDSTMVAETFEVGSSVEYTCDEGHLLVGPTVRSCLNTGFYDEFPPVCKRIECGFPAEIQHGTYELINGSSTYLSHVQYSCQPGYEMVGRSRLICDIDERWNGPPPRCDIVLCEPPPLVPNARVIVPDNATVFDASAEYICARGHKLQGPSKIACLATGLWEKPPQCIEERPSTTTTTTVPTTLSVPSTTPRLVLPTRTRLPTRPSSPTPFVPHESSRRTRPKTTTERPTTRHGQPERKVTVADAQESPTSLLPQIIVANRPTEHHVIGDGNNVRTEQTPGVNVPLPVDGNHRKMIGAKLNLWSLVALGVFSALFFIVSFAITIVLLGKSRAMQRKPYVSGDCNTVATHESSSSESRSGLSRYYQQAWENLQAEAYLQAEVYQQPDCEAPKDDSELVVLPAQPRDKRRHHHHHRHADWPRSSRARPTHY